MVVAVFAEAVADDLFGEFGAVAVFAEVAEVDVFEFVSGDFDGEGRGGVVGEVAVAGEDALFDGPRAAGVVVEEGQIVVGFQD